MPKLNKILPETGVGVRRETLLQVADTIRWLHQNKPDALQAAIKAGGAKEVKAALNDLEDHCELWR